MQQCQGMALLEFRQLQRATCCDTGHGGHTRELYQLESFDDQYRELVVSCRGSKRSDLSLRWERLKADEVELGRLQERFVEAIAKYGRTTDVPSQDGGDPCEETKLRVERRALDRVGKERFDVPESLSVLREMLEKGVCRSRAGVSQSSATSSDNCCPTSSSISSVNVMEVACIRERACGWPLRYLQPHAIVPGLETLLTREVTIDLFEPPQRERIRTQAAEWAAIGLGPKAIAAEIAASSAERPSDTAVQNALSLHARMRDLGLASPYVMVDSPPHDYPKLRRHKNGRYQFFHSTAIYRAAPRVNSLD